MYPISHNSLPEDLQALGIMQPAKSTTSLTLSRVIWEADAVFFYALIGALVMYHMLGLTTHYLSDIAVKKATLNFLCAVLDLAAIFPLHLQGVCLFVLIDAVLAWACDESLVPVILIATLLLFAARQSVQPPVRHKLVGHYHAAKAESFSASRDRALVIQRRAAAHTDFGNAKAGKHFTLAAQSREIIRSLSPRRCDNLAANRLAEMTKDCLLGVVPEAEVHAIPGGNAAMLCARGAQFHVDIVVSVAEDVLVDRLRQYFKRRGSPAAQPVPMKNATKLLSEMLPFARFWRSQLSSPECKVVLVTAEDLPISQYPMYINFHLNAQYPLRMKTLLSECDLLRRKLVLVVTYWAGRRCVVNIQRGQLTKYAWAALVWYFCKHKPRDFKETRNVIGCFHSFVVFYTNWCNQHSQPSACFSESVQIPSDKQVPQLPFIEDPLEPSSNLAAFTTVVGFARVKEELQRARDILDGTLDGDLFEKWTFSE